MTELMGFLADFSTLLRSLGVLAGAVITMGILHRVLQRGDGPPTGRRFRNQLITFSASVAMVLLVILALPLSDEMRGQLLGLAGLVISATIAMSSTTFLGNAMAGIMLKTVRNFRSGDFVQVGDNFGRVSERGLFHTEIQTPDRDLVTLPNMYLATTPVRVIRTSGTIVSATCSLGYDVYHTRIEELLAAAATEAGLTDPFVQILELGDFSVTYKVAGLLVEVKSLLATRSRLRAAMLDSLHDGGVEIVSPSFRNVRTYDADRPFIPARAVRRQEPAQDAAPVDVVFDKAEVAESQAALRKRKDDLNQELKDAGQAVKEAESEQTANRARRRVELLKARLERLDETIAASNESLDSDDEN